MSTPTLFGEASARLPLFDDLPDGAVDRLAAGGLGRGLLTAGLRARLRKAGLADMGALALATPADLMAVRKVGPVRVGAIRAHVLSELARLVPGAREEHDQGATDRRRLDRLHTLPTGRLPLIPAVVARFDPAGATWADLALMHRAQAAGVLGISMADLDGIVAALARALLPDRRLIQPTGPLRDDEAGREAVARRERDAMQRERDREWDEAAPVDRSGRVR